MREWKPGDLALVEFDGENRWALRTGVASNMGWEVAYPDRRSWVSDQHDFPLKPLRPLVVIDPEDREQVGRFTDTLWAVTEAEVYVLGVQEAFREFANPTPAKPAEPTGLGAVVEDDNGLTWVRRHPAGPAWVNGYQRWAAWDDIAAVRVLSEGVQ